MSSLLVSLLLILALVFPLIGAAALRLLASRMSQRQIISFAVLLVALPVVSAVALSRANIASMQLAGVTLVLTQPTVGLVIPQDVLDALPTEDAPSVGDETADPTPGKDSSPQSTASPAVATTVATSVPAASATTPPTIEPPTATPEPPTATPEPPTPEPPTATPAPAAPARRTYVVQQGDTLRGIAEQFNVSVAALLSANNLTAEQADALRPGQELIIP